MVQTLGEVYKEDVFRIELCIPGSKSAPSVKIKNERMLFLVRRDTLRLLLVSQLEVLATLENSLCLVRTLRALQTENDLLGGLSLYNQQVHEDKVSQCFASVRNDEDELEER